MEQDKEKLEIGMIEQFADLQDKRVLEVGCGDGRITASLADKAKAYIAIDPDVQNIAKARSKIGGADFRIGSGENLDFKDVSFDVVLFTLSFHHQNGLDALREAHRVLRETGRLVIIEPTVEGEVQQFFNIFNDETEALQNALSAIEESDFEINQQETFETVWTFQDKEELYNYDFERHDVKTDCRIIERMNELLGAKMNDRPIHLKETLVIFSLRKREK